MASLSLATYSVSLRYPCLSLSTLPTTTTTPTTITTKSTTNTIGEVESGVHVALSEVQTRFFPLLAEWWLLTHY